jgi:hypothetical protein
MGLAAMREDAQNTSILATNVNPIYDVHVRARERPARGHKVRRESTAMLSTRMTQARHLLFGVLQIDTLAACRGA